MDNALEGLVRDRAGGICEYCNYPIPPFHVEHIIARKHKGATSEENLALACAHCNLHKGPNLSGIDPQTGHMVRLFHPRKDVWVEHFRWRGAHVEGLTATGRATIVVLEINQAIRVRSRQRLIVEGLFRTD